MSRIDMSKADEKNASLELKLKAKSGYSAEFDYVVSPNQWAEIVAICEDGSKRRVMSASESMLSALEAMVLNDSHTYRDCHKAALAAISKARAALSKVSEPLDTSVGGV